MSVCLLACGVLPCTYISTGSCLLTSWVPGSKFALSAWDSEHPFQPSIPRWPFSFPGIRARTPHRSAPISSPKAQAKGVDWIVPHPAGSSWVFSESLDTLLFVFFGRVAKSIKIGSGDLEPAFYIHTGITRTQPPFSVPVPSGEIAAPSSWLRRSLISAVGHLEQFLWDLHLFMLTFWTSSTEYWTL